MTFQNTTISLVTSGTVNSNYDGQEETGFCQGYNVQSVTFGTGCNNTNVGGLISLNNLNNQLATLTCQAFIYQNDTTVGFIAAPTCGIFGAYVSASIVFIANQQVTDFLNSNNIQHCIISSNTCQLTSKFPLCIPLCKSLSQIANLLSPPTKYSIISVSYTHLTLPTKRIV